MIENLRVTALPINGQPIDVPYASGKALIGHWLADDWGPPPRALILEASHSDGRTVTLSIPYDECRGVFVDISDGD